MRQTKGKLTPLALAGAAIAFGCIAVPGGAQAAKVTETVPGGQVPNGSITFDPPAPRTIAGGPLIQSFRLRGAKVKDRQVLDVNLTINSTGSGPGALGELHVKLVGPKGENLGLELGTAQSAVDVRLDDQSEFILCNQFFFQASECNYQQGATPPSRTNGFFTGEAAPFRHLNPVFQGTNPKGTWRLFWWDNGDGPTSTIGETTLQVKTGRKFAKRG